MDSQILILSNTIKTAAIIGSFRQRLNEVRRAWQLFNEVGLEVTSPQGTLVLEEGIPFVRFTSDPRDWSDPMIQTVALHRIFRADFVYVVAPDGYVGRTTCYEIGRIVQLQRPLYFSSVPIDLPIVISKDHVYSLEEIVALLRNGYFRPQCMFNSSEDKQGALERDLLLNKFRDDNQF
jgi:hypothetical protein